MQASDFDFHLPDASIALRPANPRDSARLLVVAPGCPLTDLKVSDLPGELRAGDILVLNDTKVIPARLKGVRHRGESRVAVEATLHRRLSPYQWTAFMRPGKRLAEGDRVVFGESSDRACLLGALDATLSAKGEGGEVTLNFDLSGPALDAAIAERGSMPLPPYIAAKRPQDEQDRRDYQTVYAQEDGSVAAPTAGLHFTPELFARLKAIGVETAFVTLHVGAGTFLPMKTEIISEHRMHPEWGEVDRATAERLNAVRRAGGRIVCVGTTSLRLLESATSEDGVIGPFMDETAIFITPGYRFRAADGLMTNFHLPKSTLFMLVSAFAGLAAMRAAYAHAVATGYRFYSYGDASSALEGRLMAAFPFKIAATDGKARTGLLSTPRGEIRTPAFMPVGTAGTVKALTVEQVAQTGADILLGNTYHLMLRPTAERVARLGGLHRFMRWEKPILTDSGGFQVMSLSKISKVTEEAVTFQSHIDGSKHVLTPERSIEIQADLLGSDIVMQLDELVALPATEDRAAEAMRRSARWGERSKAAFGARESQALFGIQQGGMSPALRRESAERLTEIGFDGYAIGGLAVGEGHAGMVEVLDYAPDMLPPERPRYLMGVGKPIDIVEAVARGVDMFDCVLPTRSGRHGQAWTWEGSINLKNARFTDDEAPLDATSDCPASRDYSKAYLHHLVKSEEILGQVLLSWHNLAFFQTLMAALRSAIAEGRMEALRREFLDRQRPRTDG